MKLGIRILNYDISFLNFLRFATFKIYYDYLVNPNCMFNVQFSSTNQFQQILSHFQLFLKAVYILSKWGYILVSKCTGLRVCNKIISILSILKKRRVPRGYALILPHNLLTYGISGNDSVQKLEAFFKKHVLRISYKIHRKASLLKSLSNNVASLQPKTVLKKTLIQVFYRCFCKTIIYTFFIQLLFANAYTCNVTFKEVLILPHIVLKLILFQRSF